ncbi:MAG: hypothetical protein BGP05_18985 [Rhizobiales bacterium 62-47]|nr:MAG: hypothetical protein BGP05_18985 [Rhizobiales bacterium 62-47]
MLSSDIASGTIARVYSFKTLCHATDVVRMTDAPSRCRDVSMSAIRKLQRRLSRDGIRNGIRGASRLSVVPKLVAPSACLVTILIAIRP